MYSLSLIMQLIKTSVKILIYVNYKIVYSKNTCSWGMYRIYKEIDLLSSFSIMQRCKNLEALIICLIREYFDITSAFDVHLLINGLIYCGKYLHLITMELIIVYYLQIHYVI